ncbi:hypothetical protein [Streptomyces exfoliatus]|uniref:hypothetical protein n=1 Tax=Streptomyces exfoliatus TaxID=1905 RepID=UPI003C2EE2B7
MARALAAEPDILVCDQVTSALGTDTAEAVMDLLGQLRAERALTLVLISHDLRLLESPHRHPARPVRRPRRGTRADAEPVLPPDSLGHRSPPGDSASAAPPRCVTTSRTAKARQRPGSGARPGR